jgi:cell division protein FtsB
MLKIFWVFLVLLIVLSQYRLWDGEGGIAEIMTLKKDVALQQAENQKLISRNHQLAEEVRALKQGGKAIEAKARMDLGMIREGEQFYMVFDSADKKHPE